jgi:hypothetical protein
MRDKTAGTMAESKWPPAKLSGSFSGARKSDQVVGRTKHAVYKADTRLKDREKSVKVKGLSFLKGKSHER